MSGWKSLHEIPASHVETLKSILDKTQTPALLDDHPWTKSQIAQNAALQDPSILDLPPGERLLAAIGNLFIQMMPSLPPRRGIRLDTRWGEFGLLAARYFAPLKYETPFPISLRDAWGRIDQSILLFVFGHADGSLSEEKKACYRLVGNEPEVAAASTLSDWHKKGLQRLANLIHDREAHLQKQAAASRVTNINSTQRSSQRLLVKRLVFLFFIGLGIFLLILGGLKAYRIYVLSMEVKQDLQGLDLALPSSPDPQRFVEAASHLPGVERDLQSLTTEVRPLLWLGQWLRWVPVYGGDLAHAGDLLDLAQRLTVSARMSEGALDPLMQLSTSDSQPSLYAMLDLLTRARPQLIEAQMEFLLAQEARRRIAPNHLSAPLQEMVRHRIDPAMGWMGDGLSLALAFPSVMGAETDGPKTYLLLVQNEDELRSSGGFITAVGKLVLDHGKVVDLSFESSDELDNWSMPYPMAPWQLSEYMNSPVLILRDANWFPDFPTTALYVEQLYAYTHQNSVNGILAFDQHMLVMLLQTLGPLEVEGASFPITADNVISYMRESKSPPAGQPIPADWNRKGFIDPLAEALVQKVLNADLLQWGALSTTMLQALEQRHLLLEMDDQNLQALLEQHAWNGALESSGGDFLMVTDSNIGFNKTSAVVDTELAYDVDLTDLAKPVAELFVRHMNRAQADVPCKQWDESQIIGDYYYPIDRCYWDYMRVYTPQGTTLLSATPETIPDSWMILNRHVLPSADVLDEEWQGLQGFGTLIVVPGGQSVNTSMRFALPPARILTEDTNHLITYQLNVKKQPGTLNDPLTIRIHLPSNAVLESQSSNWIINGQNILFQTDLKVNVHLEVIFHTP